jgi:hypothetical protein
MILTTITWNIAHTSDQTSVVASDTGRCPRCLIKLMPDSDDPARVGPPQAVVGRSRGRVPHQARAKVDAA